MCRSRNKSHGSYSSVCDRLRLHVVYPSIRPWLGAPRIFMFHYKSKVSRFMICRVGRHSLLTDFSTGNCFIYKPKTHMYPGFWQTEGKTSHNAARSLNDLQRDLTVRHILKLLMNLRASSSEKWWRSHFLIFLSGGHCVWITLLSIRVCISCCVIPAIKRFPYLLFVFA